MTNELVGRYDLCMAFHGRTSGVIARGPECEIVGDYQPTKFHFSMPKTEYMQWEYCIVGMNEAAAGKVNWLPGRGVIEIPAIGKQVYFRRRDS